MSYYSPYVPVAKRRQRAKKQMDKLRKKGKIITPIEIEGRTIAKTFWGKGWCEHIESFRDYESRLPRGRTYARNGSVCHLEINPGEIKAIVSGSELYHIHITISPLKKKKWQAIKQACSGQIGSLLDLLAGRLSEGVMGVVSDRIDGLFPLANEVKLNCDCLDWATMCKHVAAVLYGVGARLDEDPAALFSLRQVNHEELIDLSTESLSETLLQGQHEQVDANEDLSALFGVELGSAAEPVTSKSSLTTSTSSKAITQRPKYYSGIRLRKLRHSLGLTQKSLAQQLKLSPSRLSQFENLGRKKVPLTPELENKLSSLLEDYNRHAVD